MRESDVNLTPSQRVCWDPSLFVGFSPEQLELIRRGFFCALDRVFEKERGNNLEGEA